MKRIFIILFILFMLNNAWAVLPAPPVLKDDEAEISQYFKELYDNRNSITVITTSPNGNRTAKSSGEVVIVNTNNVFKLWVNQGGKVWVQI